MSYTCPNCGKIEKRRVRGACPSCGELVELWNGFWVRTSDGSPTENVLRHFEELVNNLFGDLDVKWHIPAKSEAYKRNMALIEKMIVQADGDINLVKDTITRLYRDEKFSWKKATSLVQIFNDYPLALAIVKAEKEKEEQNKQKRDEFLDKVMNREDIFNVQI